MVTNYKIDNIDRSILSILMKDAKTPYTKIAKNYLFRQELFMYESKRWKELRRLSQTKTM